MDFWELIDTLWNVNICKGLGIHLQDIELIDTLWNVNKLLSILSRLMRRGINRYIMECKCIFELCFIQP